MNEQEALSTARDITLARLEKHADADVQGTFIHSLFPLAELGEYDLRWVIGALAELTSALAVQLADLRSGYGLPHRNARTLVRQKADELILEAPAVVPCSEVGSAA